MVQYRVILTMADQYKVEYDLSNGAIFSDLERPLPAVSRSLHFYTEYFRNDMIYRHSFNGTLIGTYTRPTQQCHFQ